MIRSLVFALLLTACAAIAPLASAQGFRASASKIDITPKNPIYIAGYAANRKSAGVHDPVWARCLVLESGGNRIAIVSCDLIGVPRYIIEKLRGRIKSVAPERLFIAATHTHSGPDTLGQWGPDFQTSGIDKAWWSQTQDRIVEMVESTAKKLEPAAVRFATTTKVPRASRNARVPQILDTELAVMEVTEPKGQRAIATFVNFACHPETLNNRQITSDFPNWIYQVIEKEKGGTCLYLNGAQGGMITADFDETVGVKGENWKAAEDIGTGLAHRALEILKEAPLEANPPIQTSRRVFEVPMENQNFKMLIKLKVFPDFLKNGNVETEVNRIAIGSAEFLTLPGEVLPNIGLMLKRYMKGKPKFLLGLTCDELGYILCDEDFGLPLYRYETSVSVGSQMGTLMVQNLRALLSEAR